MIVYKYAIMMNHVTRTPSLFSVLMEVFHSVLIHSGDASNELPIFSGYIPSIPK